MLQTSTPTKGEYASWELKKEIPRAMGEGDQPRLSQLLMARSSLREIELPDDPVIAGNIANYRVLSRYFAIVLLLAMI